MFTIVQTAAAALFDHSNVPLLTRMSLFYEKPAEQRDTPVDVGIIGAAVVGVAVVGAAVFGGDVVGVVVFGVAVVGAAVVGAAVVGVVVVGTTVFGAAVVGVAVVGVGVFGAAVVVGTVASSVLVLPGRWERFACMKLETNVKTWKEDLKEL